MENDEVMEQDEELEGLEEGIQEEPQDDSLDIADVLNDSEEQPGEEEPQGTSGQKEPGYVRSRIDKAVAKAIAETEARMQANFEQQIAPYREHMLEMEAQDLVRTGKVKDLDTARELVRYRQGQPQPERQEQPRNEQGQYTSNQEPSRDPATQARIDMLEYQAKKIKDQRGVDVIEEFRTNNKVKQKLVSGEWDFYDVADYMSGKNKRAPAPMRSPNGASGANRTAIENMSDEQFDRLVRNVQGGKRYSQK